MGRTSKRTPAIEKAILAGLRKGIPLAELCRRPGMPCPETWRNWCRFDYDLELAYADARAIGYGTIMEEAFSAALQGVVFPDRRVEAQLKLAAKWNPLGPA